MPTLAPRRGRPPKVAREDTDTRQALIRSGLEVFTEQGLAATGLDAVLKRAQVPKGSFYHYFASKEAFGHAVLAAYGQYFAHKLERTLGNPGLAPLQRLEAFVADAQAGMARFDYRRGCLVGNLGQEVLVLPASFREALEQMLGQWQARLAQCLAEALAAGQLAAGSDCQALAGFFWIGWEGAVMRARLAQHGQPLQVFIQGYLAGLPRP
ncbi:TetR family transcriptional regulator C-terminal domain-containing protein [Pseudomonas sp. NPDC007930]|uniref:acrylate utilization transcriptional regulator AcuR n=1 Tax=Pseudomonas sp. NPDC007930 TaxID=3364417 RepID=UPI0036E953AA